MNNLASSFETALTALNTAQATNDFFPSQASVFADQEIVSAVAGILGLIGGLVGLGEGAALAGTLISGISGGALGFAGTALGAPPPTPGNLTTAYSQIHDTTLQAYNDFAEAIFTNGSVDSTDVSMSSLMANGALLVEPDFDAQIVTTEFQKSVYAQLAVAAWAQTSGLTPFITYVLPLGPTTNRFLTCPAAGMTQTATMSPRSTWSSQQTCQAPSYPLISHKSTPPSPAAATTSSAPKP